MADDRAPDDALNQFWNALVQSDAEPPLGNLDPMQAETIRQLHAMARTPPPTEIQARVNHTVKTLQRGIDITPTVNGHVRSGARVSGSLARGADRWPLFDQPVQPAIRQPVRHLRWPSVPFATAFLLLVTLSLAYIAAGPGRPFIERRAVLPAVRGVASVETLPEKSSSTTTTLETIFATTLPPEMLPTGGYLNFGFWRLALPPGVSTPVPPEGQSCCCGPQITHVLAGELTVQVDAPLQLFRGSTLGSSGVEVAPGTSTVVRPGDTIIYDFPSAAVYANHGASPVQIVSAGFNTGALSGAQHWVTTMDYLDGSQEFSQSPLPLGPLAVSLVRAVLPPNGEVPAPPHGAFVLEVGENGDASVGKRADDGSLFNINDKTETIYVVMFEPLGTPTLMP